MICNIQDYNWIIYWMFITASRWIIQMDHPDGSTATPGPQALQRPAGRDASATAAGAHAAQLAATQLSQA
jgi:hypothetical protein